jgi:hypothetical protein
MRAQRFERAAVVAVVRPVVALAFFVQDSWRPSRRVTVDLGLRHDLRPPMMDRRTQLGNFDAHFPGGRVIVSDEAGLALVPDFVRQSVPNTPFITADQAGLPKTLRRTDRNNISPRIGIAWRPTEDGRTVIRGGFGLYTVPLLGSVNYSMVATVTAAAVDFTNNPANPFAFPNISSAASAEGALPPGTLDFRRANQIDMRDPRTAQWSVTVERDLGWNAAARVSYVGSYTTDLIWSPDLNQVPANTVGYDSVRNTRPFLDWNVVTTRANDPRSRCDALGVALTKRISSGFMFDASYTLAKHKSDAGGAVPTAFAAENGATTADLFRGNADYGHVAFTRRHRFVSTFLRLTSGWPHASVKRARSSACCASGSLLAPARRTIPPQRWSIGSSPASTCRVSRVDVVRRYARIAGVRVPVELESTAHVRLAGRSEMRITYQYTSINGHDVVP